MLCLRKGALLTFVWSCCALEPAEGQSERLRDSIPLRFPVFIGSAVEDRARLDGLSGAGPAPYSLLRSALESTSDSVSPARRFRFLAPSLDVTWNSTLPSSFNDGAQWAGRGATVSISGGARLSWGRLSANVLPYLWATQNRAFPILPTNSPARSGFASPWHSGNISADLPLRFGNTSIVGIQPGESAIWVTERSAAYGFATESQWWGPGIRNALVMSNNAGGFPHAFVRTSHPIDTRIGSVEAKWFIGSLSESQFFDKDTDNDLRSISGVAVTLAPAFERNLTAGVTRVVFDNVNGVGELTAHSFDAVARWGSDLNPRNAPGNSAEQLASAFARWVFPRSGAEVYGEWSRILLPVSLREALVAPQFTQGFTVGLQWLPRVTARSTLRVQVEMTNLEQSPATRAADTLSFYTSSVVPQGYTHRGQVIGAAIGPGSSSQWLALDLLRRSRSLGAFLGRIRWDTDAYYTTPQSFAYFSYDATVFAGLRGSFRIWSTDLAAELSFQRRYNFLFQNEQYGYSRGDAFDKNNVTMKVRVN